jgi:hypothetical protein
MCVHGAGQKILKEQDHPEDGYKWEDNIRMDLNKVG